MSSRLRAISVALPADLHAWACPLLEGDRDTALRSAIYPHDGHQLAFPERRHIAKRLLAAREKVEEAIYGAHLC